MERLNLGFDIDDTIADTVKLSVTMLNQYFNKNIKEEDVHGRFAQVYDIPQTEVDEFFLKFGNDIFNNLEFFPMSREYINNWYDKGDKVTLITARPLVSEDVTKLWLKKNDIKYHELYFDVQKSSLAKSLNLDIFVDDHPQIVSDMYNEGIQSIFMDLPKNKKIDVNKDIFRAKDWNEVYRIVENIRMVN